MDIPTNESNKITGKDLTDDELRQITRNKREDLRQFESKPQRIDSVVGGRLSNIGRRKKKAGKYKGKNRRELPDNRYIIITNKFVEAMSRQYLRPNESKVVWFLIRKTWGWQKRADFISLRQFSKELGISKVIACQVLSRLKHRRIVNQLANKTYAIQTDVSLWRNEPKKSRKKGVKCRPLIN